MGKCVSHHSVGCNPAGILRKYPIQKIVRGSRKNARVASRPSASRLQTPVCSGWLGMILANNQAEDRLPS